MVFDPFPKTKPVWGVRVVPTAGSVPPGCGWNEPLSVVAWFSSRVPASEVIADEAVDQLVRTMPMLLSAAGPHHRIPFHFLP